MPLADARIVIPSPVSEYTAVAAPLQAITSDRFDYLKAIRTPRSEQKSPHIQRFTQAEDADFRCLIRY